MAIGAQDTRRLKYAPAEKSRWSFLAWNTTSMARWRPSTRARSRTNSPRISERADIEPRSTESSSANWVKRRPACASRGLAPYFATHGEYSQCEVRHAQRIHGTDAGHRRRPDPQDPQREAPPRLRHLRGHSRAEQRRSRRRRRRSLSGAPPARTERIRRI